MFRSTRLQSDHRLVVSKLRLKLKVKRKTLQPFTTYQFNPCLLMPEQVETFRKVLTEELKQDLTGEMEKYWNTFKDSFHNAQSYLPTVPLKEEKDWVTDEVRELSENK